MVYFKILLISLYFIVQVLLSERRNIGNNMLCNTVMIFFDLILILLIPCNIICFVLLKPITRTYKV
jgi:hypothetical protein